MGSNCTAPKSSVCAKELHWGTPSDSLSKEIKTEERPERCATQKQMSGLRDIVTIVLLLDVSERTVGV